MALHGQAAAAIDPLAVVGDLLARFGGRLQPATEAAQPSPNHLRSRLHSQTGGTGQTFLQALARDLAGIEPGHHLRVGGVSLARRHAQQRLSLSDISRVAGASRPTGAILKSRVDNSVTGKR